MVDQFFRHTVLELHISVSISKETLVGSQPTWAVVLMALHTLPVSTAVLVNQSPLVVQMLFLSQPHLVHLQL